MSQTILRNCIIHDLSLGSQYIDTSGLVTNIVAKGSIKVIMQFPHMTKIKGYKKEK